MDGDYWNRLLSKTHLVLRDRIGSDDMFDELFAVDVASLNYDRVGINTANWSVEDFGNVNNRRFANHRGIQQ